MRFEDEPDINFSKLPIRQVTLGIVHAFFA